MQGAWTDESPPARPARPASSFSALAARVPESSFPLTLPQVLGASQPEGHRCPAPSSLLRGTRELCRALSGLARQRRDQIRSARSPPPRALFPLHAWRCWPKTQRPCRKVKEGRPGDIWPRGAGRPTAQMRRLRQAGVVNGTVEELGPGATGPRREAPGRSPQTCPASDLPRTGQGVGPQGSRNQRPGWGPERFPDERGRPWRRRGGGADSPAGRRRVAGDGKRAAAPAQARRGIVCAGGRLGT